MKKSITIIGRRWFQKSCGNTYHTVKVYVNNELLEESEKTYGYGDQYKQTGYEILLKHNVFSKFKTQWDIENYMRDNRKSFLISHSDVSREKDL